jgi:hypothetical protein
MATPASRAIFSAAGGELALRRDDEPGAALLGVAAPGHPHLRNVTLAHFITLPTMLRAASVSALLGNPGERG